MKVHVPKGKYVVAVSGGVDSMTLLDLLAKQRALELIVVHFNHGIRPDAQADEEFVKKMAKEYQLPFAVGYGKLGPKTSEEQARDARYRFLKRVQKEYQADAIITAHHQDDVIETAILNILRGTGRRGLSAIAQNPDVLRPMLHLSKKEILVYANKQRLRWREDPTNKDETYLRNYIRRQLLPKLTSKQRQQFVRNLNKITSTNRLINQEIAKLSQNIVDEKVIKRSGFIALPSEVAREVLMYFLRQNHIRQFDKKTIDRLAVAIKTAKPGSKHDGIQGATLTISRNSATLLRKNNQRDALERSARRR